MINKIQLNYNQKKESEEIKKNIFNYITKIPQNQLQSHLNHLNQSQKIWFLLNDLYDSLYSVMETQFKLQACKQKNHCFQEYYVEFLGIITKHNNFDNETLKTIFIQGLFNEIWLLVTPKFIKIMTEAYLIDKFYTWIHNWAVDVKHTSSFSSTSGYQQLQSSNNTCFSTPCYPSTAPTTTSVTKPATITDWPTPTKLKQVQSFLGFANFYRCFIANFSKTAKPLTHLTQKDTLFSWTSECQHVFKKLK